MSASFTMNSYLGKRVLALVREGDYAHAGEEEAIELTLRGLAKNPARYLLDAGCGRGGTADYLQRHGWGQVTGLDIEADSITEARQRYPDCRFVAGDVVAAETCLAEHFDLITLFNAFYAFPEQTAALRSLAGVAAPDARLRLFDYVNRGGYRAKPIMTDGRPSLPQPMDLAAMPDMLRASGWRLEAIDDLTGDYTRWYGALVARIESKRAAIEDLAGAEGYATVHWRYADLLADCQEGRLGGAVVRARAVI